MGCVCLVTQLCPTLYNPCTVDSQASLSMEFFTQEYWSGLPCPPTGHLPDPGIEPMSPVSPALADRFFTSTQPVKPLGKCHE